MADTNNKRRIVICGKGGGGQAESVEWDDILNKPEFATVATSGDYDDLTDKPTILTQWFGTQAEYDAITVKDPNTVYNIEGSDNVQPDWNQTDTTADDYIKNKPTIPAVPPMNIETLTFTLQGGTVKTVEFYTVPNYFYVEDVSGSDNTLSITKNNDSAPTVEVFCSTDRANWVSMGSTSTTPITATIPANGKLYLKANTDKWSLGEWERNSFLSSDNFNVGGNIMSLLYGDNFDGAVLGSNNTGAFQYLFYESYVQSAADLILPNNTVSTCYLHLFSHSRITTPPVLPATTLAESCYHSMFETCTALTTVPTDLLPATTLAENCYIAMFMGCNSLTQAPALPARILVQECYFLMFSGCSSLNRIVTYAQDISTGDCLTNWVDGVSATGDFYNLGGATYESGISGIPTGWTEHTSL